MVALGVGLLAMGVALDVMKSSIPGAVALSIAAAGILLLTPALVALSLIPMENIVNALVLLGGALLTIGLAAAIFEPVIVPMMGLGVAIALIGAGCALAGAGLLALATAFNLIAISGAGAAYAVTNILTAMLARAQGWSVGDFIKGEGEVQEMIRENKTKDFNLSHELDYIPQLMKIVEETDPVRKEKMIDAFKWIWLDERTFFEPFSMEAVFAYLCKLAMQQRWAKLDVEQGKETFQKIIDDLRSEAQVPEEFVVPSIQRQI